MREIYSQLRCGISWIVKARRIPSPYHIRREIDSYSDFAR